MTWIRNSGGHPITAGNGTISSGIDFPQNGDGSVDRVQIRWTGAVRPQFPNGTVIWKCRPKSQTSYFSAWFYGRTDGSLPTTFNDYLGCTPYPQGGAGGFPHNWEVATEGNDFIVDDNGNSTLVSYDTWYSQACTVSSATAKFYWNLRVNTNRVITRNNAGGGFIEDSTAPGFVVGDASWAPNAERFYGTLRGYSLWNAVLSLADIQTLEAKEDDAALLAAAASLGLTSSLHYCNLNWTPSDVSDKSGNGNSPVWMTSDHGTLWTP